MRMIGSAIAMPAGAILVGTAKPTAATATGAEALGFLLVLGGGILFCIDYFRGWKRPEEK